MNDIRIKVLFSIIVALLSVVFLLCSSGLAVNADSQEESENTRLFTSIQIEEGDTLWDIACTYAPDNTAINDYIEELMQLNGLHSTTIQKGMYLTISYYMDNDFSDTYTFNR